MTKFKRFYKKYAFYFTAVAFVAGGAVGFYFG